MTSDFWPEFFKFLGILVTVSIPNAVTYAKTKRALKDQHGEIATKLDTAVTVNETQIEKSNNFNQKIGKLVGQVAAVDRKIERLDRHVRTLSDRTGIPIEEGE